MIEKISAVGGITSAQFDKEIPANSATSIAAPSFSETLKAAASSTVESLKTSETTAIGSMRGEAGLQDVVQATIRAELAVETAVSVRNKIIESYQEIMRMPV